MQLTHLSTAALINELRTCLGHERRAVVRTIVYLREIEERRIHLKDAYSSMFDFCTRGLGFSEGEAYRRITAARKAREFPLLLKGLDSGKVHLSAVLQLSPHLTEENHEALLDLASGK